MKKLLACLIILFYTTSTYIGWVFFYQKTQSEQLIWIPAKSGLKRIEAELKSCHLQTYKPLLWLYQITTRTRLQSGEYEIKPNQTLWEICDRISSGQRYMRKITFIEGKSVHHIIQTIAQNPFLTGLILHTPEEGTLMPDTYHFTRGDDRNHLIQHMERSMSDFIAKNWKPSQQLPNKSTLLILASMVECETPKAEERPIVASVFFNRLKMGMKLQSDPTTIYAITLGKNDLGRTLTFADLKINSPYNTYVCDALPCSPISCPSRSSLLAAINPITTSYTYFVANGTGGHTFSSTFKEHQKHVAIWRQTQKQNLAIAH